MVGPGRKLEKVKGLDEEAGKGGVAALIPWGMNSRVAAAMSGALPWH